MISQDEIVSNAKTVTKGLEALRQEHESILGGIQSSLDLSDSGAGDENSLIQGRHVAMFENNVWDRWRVQYLENSLYRIQVLNTVVWT